MHGHLTPNLRILIKSLTLCTLYDVMWIEQIINEISGGDYNIIRCLLHPPAHAVRIQYFWFFQAVYCIDKYVATLTFTPHLFIVCLKCAERQPHAKMVADLCAFETTSFPLYIYSFWKITLQLCAIFRNTSHKQNATILYIIYLLPLPVRQLTILCKFPKYEWD